MFGKELKIPSRLAIAAYLSIVGHLSFMVWTYNNSDSLYQPILCGPPWIYETESEEEKELSLEFGEKKADSESQEKRSGDGENGSEVSGDFSSSKYKGGKWDELVKDLESVENLRDSFKNTFEDIFPSSNVSDTYIRRNRDYEDIIVKEVFPTLRTIREPFRVDIEEADDNLAIHKERNRIIEEFRKGQDFGNPLTMSLNVEGEKPPKEPLAMPKEDRISYLDKNIKRNKEIQLNDFISRYMGYDPNKGDLSQFVRDLYYENLQRLAYTFSGDITFFTIDYFQENLNKEDFLRQMMALLSQNMGTKVGTEILFTLENIYEIQNRALNLYFQNRPLYTTYSDEKKKELRVETIRRVVEKYRPILKDKQINNAFDAEQAFTQKRLEIMDTLIQNSPANYRVKDAIFEKGRILWEAGMQRNDENLFKQALLNWQKISQIPEQGDFLYKSSFNALESLLKPANYYLGNSALSRSVVDEISFILRTRLNESLEQKRIREDQLLWPKGGERAK